jgi:hypothetical protein
MVDFMLELHDLTRARELVSAEALAVASQAKCVTYRSGVPLAVDGPIEESDELPAG